MSLGTDLRALVSKERLRRFVEGITRFERPSGTSGEMQALEFMKSELKKSGVESEIIPLPAWISMPQSASLEVLAPEKFSIPCKTRAFSPTTPEQGVEGELISVEKAAETGKATSIFEYRGKETDGAFAEIDVTGKIVLSRSGGPDGYYAAQNAGALGQIALWPSDENVIHEMTVNGVWGTATPDTASRLPRMATVTVKNDDGERLIALCNKGPVKVRLSAEANTRWETIYLLTALIPPSTGSPLFTMVGAHHCSWHFGCTDNATGDACLLELANNLNQRRGDLKHGVRFCWWPGHSQGRYAGSTWFIDNYFEDLNKNCIGYINIDSPGVKGATEYEGRYIMAEIESLVLGAIKKVTGQDASIKRPYRAGDQSFLNAGLTSMGAYSMLPASSPDWALVGGSAGAWWWHSEEDTIDKWSDEVLEKDTEIYLELLAALSTSAVIPFEITNIANHLAERVNEIEKEDNTGFDMSKAKKAIANFKTQGEKLAEVIPGMTDGDDAARVNSALLCVCRTMNSVLYSVAGNYEQDSALQQPVLPSLSKLSSLGSMDSSSSDYHFLKTYLVRERNRLTDTLDRSARLMSDTAEIVKS